MVVDEINKRKDEREQVCYVLPESEYYLQNILLNFNIFFYNRFSITFSEYLRACICMHENDGKMERERQQGGRNKAVTKDFIHFYVCDNLGFQVKISDQTYSIGAFLGKDPEDVKHQKQEKLEQMIVDVSQ